MYVMSVYFNAIFITQRWKAFFILKSKNVLNIISFVSIIFSLYYWKSSSLTITYEYIIWLFYLSYFVVKLFCLFYLHIFITIKTVSVFVNYIWTWVHIFINSSRISCTLTFNMFKSCTYHKRIYFLNGQLVILLCLHCYI